MSLLLGVASFFVDNLDAVILASFFGVCETPARKRSLFQVEITQGFFCTTYLQILRPDSSALSLAH